MEIGEVKQFNGRNYRLDRYRPIGLHQCTCFGCSLLDGVDQACTAKNFGVPQDACFGGILSRVEVGGCEPPPFKPHYQQLCVKTCVKPGRLGLTIRDTDLLHAAMGISTEAGELLDNLKKVFYYGKVFDEVNFKEELGDVLWYVGMICERMGWQMDDIMATNIAKLKVRYPEKFTEAAAEKRDLEAERAVLEEHHQEEHVDVFYFHPEPLVADVKDPSVHVNPPIVSVADAEDHELWCGVC